MRDEAVSAVIQHEIGPFTIADWQVLREREDGSRLELVDGRWLVTPAPTGQHQAAASELIALLKMAAQDSGRTDLNALGGVGVEISTDHRTALVPDFAVLNAPPVGASFRPENLLLAGEIWSPGTTRREQGDKHGACAGAGIPFFWSVAQDRGGPVELAAYRLDRGRYTLDTTAKLGDGAVTTTASPVPVVVDVAALRP